jgi:hypothetical protein
MRIFIRTQKSHNHRNTESRLPQENARAMVFIQGGRKLSGAASHSRATLISIGDARFHAVFVASRDAQIFLH